MISHLLGAIKPERLAGLGACHAKLFDDRFVLTSPQELKIHFIFPACASHFRLGMTEFTKVPTPAVTRLGGPKFEREQLLHLSVCVAPTDEERDELLGV